jgi:hypothetical protein
MFLKRWDELGYGGKKKKKKKKFEFYGKTTTHY